MKKLFSFFCLLAILSLPAISQTSNPSTEKKVEVKFLYKEMYDYYINKHPEAVRGVYVDDSEKKYLILSEIEAVKEAVRTQKIEELLNNIQGVEKNVIYVSTINPSDFRRKSPYYIMYDAQGKYTIQE